jgi:hypothetical protein
LDELIRDVKRELQGEGREEIAKVMNKDDKEFDDTIVEDLIGFVFGHVIFCDVFLDELEEVTEELKIKIPILIFFENGG